MIQVYAGGDTAELFQNGKSLGKQACGKDTAFETQFHTVYEPGELVAVAYENGKEIGRTALRTAGKPAALELSAETYGTLAFINVDVVDEQGVLTADASTPRARHQGGYETPDTTAGEGHALAVLKLDPSAEDHKRITVKISGEGLTEGKIEI